MRSVTFACLFSVATVGLPSQATLLVGPGGFPQIRSAVAAAAPGDVIHVQPGTYAHFTANKTLTIRALVPGTVHVAFDPAFESPACIANPLCASALGPTAFGPPAGQAVLVNGIAFEPNIYQAVSIVIRHSVAVTSGTVSFDNCTIQATNRTALSITDAIVHLQGCVVSGVGSSSTGHGLQANGSDVIAVDSMIGGNSIFGLNLPGDGVRLVDSTLKASGCTLTGGALQFGGVGGSALVLGPSDRVWISDSTLTGGGTACAITGTPGTGAIARSNVNPSGGLCGTLPSAPVVGVERPTAIQSGATFSVVVHTAANLLVVIHASPRLAHYEIPGLFALPIALDLTQFFLAGVYSSDANGDVTASWNMPPGQYVDEALWLETIVVPSGSPILVGPAVGGVIR